MSATAVSATIKAMGEKIERLERELASKRSSPNLPSQLGDFARILRSNGIATVFHGGYEARRTTQGKRGAGANDYITDVRI